MDKMSVLEFPIFKTIYRQQGIYERMIYTSKSIRVGSKIAICFGVPALVIACCMDNIIAIIASVFLVILAILICVESGD